MTGFQSTRSLIDKAWLRKHTAFLIAFALVFIASNYISWVRLGCLHHSDNLYGFPLQWLTISLKHGPPIMTGMGFEPGPIEKIEAVHISFFLLLPSIIFSCMVACGLIVGIDAAKYMIQRWRL